MTKPKRDWERLAMWLAIGVALFGTHLQRDNLRDVVLLLERVVENQARIVRLMDDQITGD